MGLTHEQMIERVHRTVDAFNAGDFDRAVELAHEDIVFTRPGGQSEIRGIEAFRAWMEPDAFESQVIDLRDAEVQDNRVLLHQHATARGAGSGIEIELDTWGLWSFDEEGKVTRVDTYQSSSEGHRALRGE